MESSTITWQSLLNADPLPWLLESRDPAVRHMTLRLLLGQSENEPGVKNALSAAMQSDPIAGILAAQHPEGYWVKPGPGYSPKYKATVWQLIFLDQLGADPHDSRVQKACEYVLQHTQTEAGGLGISGCKDDAVPPPSFRVCHCLNGNLLRALIGFGYLDDDRVQRAIDWQARSITGEGFEPPYHYYPTGTTGPGFCCVANGSLPCAWGAVKALLALTRIPAEKREPHVQRAIKQAVEFLLSRDPLKADYPAGSESGDHKRNAARAGSSGGELTKDLEEKGKAKKPSELWFKLGFPSGYVADVLQNLEALCQAGCAGDQRLHMAVKWVLNQQDTQGRWKNKYAYNGRTWKNIELQGAQSKWVTLRACHIICAVTTVSDYFLSDHLAHGGSISQL